MAEGRVVVLVDLGSGAEAITFKDEADALEWLNGPGADVNADVRDIAPIVSRRAVLRAVARLRGQDSL